MVAKKDKYPWSNGAPIDDHTRTKHNILRQYLACYFDVRLANPQIREFKFAIIDGFSGGGRYETGEPGSPLIILEEIRRAFFRASVRRQVNNMPAVKLTGIIMFNDASRGYRIPQRTNIDV
ncbi:three-Cys-motif partner protein TcmP [Asaia sp. As-1742]|uniref:three-Cys-motif partner protein TcmP n=1 Tax=Asaia sp. As-1742 TaxID=2608325 RepID=UPI00141DE537|nr:three-Cys-motif partner protein TcmP [Asaia sp. As-1742]NIE81424.1 three-Cys-motif partner protein TcmP [Asaia sp. As-1742]